MKITTETVSRLARDVRKATDGAYGLAESARPGKPAQITDTATGLTWYGADCARRAAAYYAGMLEVLTSPVAEPVQRILRETRERHGRYCDDGRVAARSYTRRTTTADPTTPKVATP